MNVNVIESTKLEEQDSTIPIVLCLSISMHAQNYESV